VPQKSYVSSHAMSALVAFICFCHELVADKRILRKDLQKWRQSFLYRWMGEQ
jgi:hypothetical protein